MNAPYQRKDSLNLMVELTNKLLDNNLMAKYGTSLAINMGSEFQKKLNQKYLKLKEEFNTINKDDNQFISKEELTSFLNNTYKNERKFDKAFIDKLFDEIDINKDHEISIQEFICSYMLFEERLRLHGVKLQKLVQEVEDSRQKNEKAYNENKNEPLNAEGVSDYAYLHLTVVDAKGVKPMDWNGYSDPYCVIYLGDEKAKTTYKPVTLDPVWNEEFNFKVTTLKDVLKIEVYDKDNDNNDDFEGQVEIPLKEIAHQNKVEGTYSLVEKDGTVGEGELRLKMQLVWSKKDLFYTGLKKCEDHLKNISEQSARLDELMNKILDKPFGLLFATEIDDILTEKIFIKEYDISNLSKKPIVVKSNKKSFITNFENIVRGGLKINIEWGDIVYNLMWVTMGLTCLSMIDRSDFVNVLVSICMFVLFLKGREMDVVSNLSNFLQLLKVTLGYDAFWLYFHFSGFLKRPEYEKNENTIKFLAYIFSLANFIAKIMLTVSLNTQLKRLNSGQSTKKVPKV